MTFKLLLLSLKVNEFNSPIVFSHCDLLEGNIILDKQSNSCSFIDFEYGGSEHRAFDIANYFCEFAGYECDYSLFPTIDFQKRWIRKYLSELSALQNVNQDDEDVSDESVLKVLAEVRLFTMIAHLFWGTWALVQADVSDIEFNYMGFAVIFYIVIFNDKVKRLNELDRLFNLMKV